MLRVGVFELELDGKKGALAAYKSRIDDPSLFVPFRDATSGSETYGAARYLDVEESPSGEHILDFNLAGSRSEPEATRKSARSRRARTGSTWRSARARRCSSMRTEAALILVVDDDRELRELLEAVLTGAGYRVAMADDGGSGLERVAELRPRLVLVDMVMEVVGGLEFLERLRDQCAEHCPPVIALSGQGSFEQPALARGARRFLHKPPDLADLLGAVSAALG
jgi:CheY-like chemotaxis protein